MRVDPRTYGLNVKMAVDKHSLLIRVVSNLSQNRGGQLELLAIHNVLSEIGKLGLDAV